MKQRRLPARPSQIIDRSRNVYFNYEGKRILAYPGDTVASALHASGIDIFGRSFKYHRPRGLLCVSGRCPNCMMNVDGAPNIRACACAAADGMNVAGQNAWPSVENDALSALQYFDRLMPVGFYYKTLIRPKAAWHLAEPVIRRVAGLGTVDTNRIPDTEYEHVNAYTDVAVIGGGPAGLSAAIAAAEAGARVTLVDDQPSLGGHLRYNILPSPQMGESQGESSVLGYELARRLAESVHASTRIQVLSDASAMAVYQGNMVTVHQGERIVKLRAGQVVVAAGAQESPAVFPNNDLPGIMLSSGALRLANLYGVSPGARGVIVTDSDEGLRVAVQLTDAGVNVSAVVDYRPRRDTPLARDLRDRGVGLLHGWRVIKAEGARKIEAVLLESDAGDGEHRLECGFLCLAPNPDPVTALLSNADAKLTYDETLGASVPASLPDSIYAAGDVTGIHDAEVNMLQGRVAGLEAASASGAGNTDSEGLSSLKAELDRREKAYRDEISSTSLHVTGEIFGKKAARAKKFVCICEDVTEKDVRQAIDEGFADVQSLKRYSTVSMGPCQGKMCHKSYTKVISQATGRTLDAVGGTTSRPPFRPTPLGAIAGPGHMPFRMTPIHYAHVRAGGKIAEVGEWKRPHSYRDPVEEIEAVRNRVGIIDVSTLGKLDVVGKDAPALLDRIYTHYFSNLGVGRIRYGIICSDSGIIMDDGTVTRLADDHYYVTTGTGNIDLIEEWFRWWLVGTDMCAHVANVTPGFAAVNVAGPRARDTLQKLTDVDLSKDKFRYMRSARGQVAGVPTLLLRVGFVGEAGWELHFPAEAGEHVWEALLEAGEEFGILPFGVEAQRVLRLEKKHLIPGQDTDVMSNPLEADMAWAVKFEKDDFIGREALKQVSERGYRNRMVGFVMENGAVPEDGTVILEHGWPVGKVTSSRFSPSIGKGFGLAWVPDRLAAEGQRIEIRVPGGVAYARVRHAPVYDPEGVHLRE